MSIENIRAAVEAAPVKLLDGTADDVVALLAPELQGIDAALLPGIVTARLESRRFAHFRAPSGPQPGSLAHAVANYQQAVGLRPLPVGSVVNCAQGFISPIPSGHHSLPGNRLAPQPLPAQTEAQSLEQIVRQRAAIQADNTFAVGAIPAHRRTTPRKAR